MGTKNENEADPNEREKPVPSDPAEDDSAEHWDEGALVLACLAKEKSALETLMLDYGEYVYAGAAKALAKAGRQARYEPRDLLHDFFLGVMKEPLELEVLRRFDSNQGKLGPFLSAVGFHYTLKRLRAHELFWQAVGGTQPADLANIPDRPQTIPVDLREILKRILAELSETSREIFQMFHGIGRYKVQHKVTEIVEKTGLTRRQVYYRLNSISALRQRTLKMLLHAQDDDL